jgi:hypothetical protein
LVRQEIRKMPWHGSDIAGDDDPATRRAKFKNLRVSHLFGDYGLRQFKIDLLALAAEDPFTIA